MSAPDGLSLCGECGLYVKDATPCKGAPSPDVARHRAKYEVLAHRIGIDELCDLIPGSPARIAAALADGDEHLNNIALREWDWACGYITDANGNPRRLKSTIFDRRAGELSLAERVCTLKHVARYYYLAEELQP